MTFLKHFIFQNQLFLNRPIHYTCYMLMNYSTTGLSNRTLCNEKFCVRTFQTTGMVWLEVTMMCYTALYYVQQFFRTSLIKCHKLDSLKQEKYAQLWRLGVCYQDIRSAPIPGKPAGWSFSSPSSSWLLTAIFDVPYFVDD